MNIKHLIGTILLFSTVVCSSFVGSVSAERKQTKNNSIDTVIRRDLVSAWKKHDPVVTPFIGSWKDYETIWSIYPSKTKGQVCLMRRELNTAVLDIGHVKNGKVYLQSGWVISPQGEKLNVTFPNGYGTSLTIFGQLEEASKLQYVDSSYLVPLLRKYKQAGCTASLPSNNNVSQTNIENLADGFYLYGEIPNADGFGKHYIVFGKSGKTITGYGYVTHTDNIYCFQGTGRGNQIVNATSITTILDPPNSYEQVSSNQSLNLNGFYPIQDSEESKRKSVAYCLKKINQNITNNTTHRTIRVPDSFQVIIENNGMNTQFVKGKDGYYTWFWKDRPGTCLGLRGNKNPAKIQLATYNCNSRKKARTWEILMVNNNTGYKVKLPNTSYCLRDNIGIVNCNSSEATVKNLTPQQLEQFTVTPRP